MYNEVYVEMKIFLTIGAFNEIDYVLTVSLAHVCGLASFYFYRLAKCINRCHRQPP